MDCVQTSLLRDAGLRREMVMFSTPGHHQHQLLQQQGQFPAYPLADEEPYAPADRGGFLWENFSVDDLLDLGSGKEKSCGDEELLLGFEDAEEEDEEGGGERVSSPNNANTSAPSESALSFQALPPSSADLIVPAGDVAELEWVSRFVDDSYSEFPSPSITPLFHHNHSAPAPAPAPAPPAATAKKESPKARFTSARAHLKRNLGSCCFFTDSLVVPSKARSKRCRTGGRVWSLHRRPPFFLVDFSSSAASCSSASSASSCSAASSSSSISPILLYDSFAGGCPSRLPQHPPPPQLQAKKRGRKPKSLVGGHPALGASGEQQQQQPRRRCSHCGVDRTPQWRAGPMGAKTLCNACGVRYKSGRLLPEYRPAGSPTFLSHIHSNSHRKVLEMRRSKEVETAALAAVSAASASASCSTQPAQQPAAAVQPYGVV